MASNQPAAGREVLRSGIDVRKIRQPINDAFGAVPIELIGEGAATSRDGRRMSFSVIGEDGLYIRLNDKTTVNGTVRYGFTAVVQDRETGNWANSPRVGNSTDDGWATEVNNANLTVGTATRYPARVNPQTGRVTFTQGGSGGNVNITSGETVLMILGDYDSYKDCPNVPARPPTTFADSCGDSRTNTLCVPAYAYAVYQRCGYVWEKIGDTRDFGVWANELNGGSTSAWGRLFVPRWGGEIDTTTGIPVASSECMGVAFLGTSASAISCSCPTWFSDITCLKISVKWIAQPEAKPAGCPQACWDLMAGRWGTTEETTLGAGEEGCVLTGDIGPFPVQILWTQYDWGNDCFWGPDTFDPCDPCGGFGKLVLSINSSSSDCGNAGNTWMGWELKAKQLYDLLCDCGEGPITLSVAETVGPCGTLAESVTIECCDPSDIANLVRWYDPEAGVTQANGRVTKWESQTNAVFNLTAGGIYSPYYQTASNETINNRTTIGGDMIRWAFATGSTALHNATGFTMAAVWRYRSTRVNATANTQGGIFAIEGKRAVIGAVANGTSWTTRAWYRQNGTATINTIDGPNMTIGGVYLAISRVNYTAGSEAASFEVNGTVYNGTAPGNGVISADGARELTAYADAFNLLNNTENKQAIPSDTGDIVLYDRALTDDEVDVLRAYMKGKYGL